VHSCAMMNFHDPPRSCHPERSEGSDSLATRSCGTVAGLCAAYPGTPVGIVWFDGHGDCNTPETFTGDFLDAMSLSTLTGRCWQDLTTTVPGFRSIPDDHAVLSILK
jgi:hypothetical protein